MQVAEFLDIPQYSLRQAQKEVVLAARLRDLTRLHRERSGAYRRVLDALEHDPDEICSLADVPMLPVGLFKTHALRSIPEDAVFKVITSSGTGGTEVSNVYLDAAAASLQTRGLASIMTHWLGPLRLPMIIIDARSTLRNRQIATARAAGIIGMCTFGRDHFFALDDELRLDRGGLTEWLIKHEGSPILIFGFTFMVWEYLLNAVAPGEFDFRNGTLVHSGGWKKMADREVGNREYRAELERITGLPRVHNFYGMAEQTGIAFVECERGFLHAPNAADVIVRCPETWEVVADGEIGVAQLLSALPESYPGHSILTEDVVRVESVDRCPCGRFGKTISVLGRVPRSEVRGCSDSHAQPERTAA